MSAVIAIVESCLEIVANWERRSNLVLIILKQLWGQATHCARKNAGTEGTVPSFPNIEEVEEV